MAKQRRSRKTRTIEDVQAEIAQLDLQIEMMKLDRKKLELEIQFLQNGQVHVETPKAKPVQKKEEAKQ